MLTSPSSPEPIAKKRLRYEVSVPVIFFEVVGFVACCLIAPFGYLGGIFLVIVGSLLGITFQCSLCHRSVARNAVQCRHCQAAFERNDSLVG